MVAVDLRGRTPQQFAEMIANKLAALAQDQDHETTAGQVQRALNEPRRQLAEAEHRAEDAEVYAKAGAAVSAVRTNPPIAEGGGDEVLVYTMRDLSQQAARIMSEIERTGRPAFITRHGRFVAVIRPLAPGQVESRVLAEMAREIGK